MEHNTSIEQLPVVKLETEENPAKLEENSKVNEDKISFDLPSSLPSSFTCQQCNSEMNTFVEFIGTKYIIK